MILGEKMVVDTKQIASNTVKCEIVFEDLANCRNIDYSMLKSIKTFDFHTFDRILRESKRSQFKTEQDFQKYKREILNSTQDGTCELPKIMVNKENKWNILDGKIRLFAYRVLGINPVVEMSFSK